MVPNQGISIYWIPFTYIIIVENTTLNSYTVHQYCITIKSLTYYLRIPFAKEYIVRISGWIVNADSGGSGSEHHRESESAGAEGSRSENRQRRRRKRLSLTGSTASRHPRRCHNDQNPATAFFRSPGDAHLFYDLWPIAPCGSVETTPTCPTRESLWMRTDSTAPSLT